jgi:hypothetical protein
MTDARRRLALALPIIAIASVIIAILTTPIVRGPEFHRYADQRAWLGIPNAGDVVSNLAFLIVAGWSAMQLGSRGTRPSCVAWAACAGVATIGVGSGVYHAAPSDATLAWDWGPIVVTLAVITSAVIHDRLGRRWGLIAIIVAPLAAAGSVIWWLASGGTAGGNMMPYVAMQATGVALPPALALAAPGMIPARPILLGVAGFAVARVLASHDQALLSALGISGHSLKHLLAAFAAACVLHAILAPSSD